MAFEEAWSVHGMNKTTPRLHVHTFTLGFVNLVLCHSPACKM